MKNNLLPAIASFAALAATFTLPIGTVAAATAVTAAGVVGLFLADFGRTLKPVHSAGELIPFQAPSAGRPLQSRAA